MEKQKYKVICLKCGACVFIEDSYKLETIAGTNYKTYSFTCPLCKCKQSKIITLDILKKTNTNYIT